MERPRCQPWPSVMRFSRAHVSAEEGRVQLAVLRSILSSKLEGVLRSARLVWYPISDLSRSLHPAERVQVWCHVFRSFLAHIRMQRATRGCIVLPGKPTLRDGRYQWGERTIACAEGIEKLKNAYPWTGLPHMQAFLVGFEEGERYGISQRQSNLDRSPTESAWKDSSKRTLSEENPPFGHCGLTG
jgi:hypothetical protein